ncbi:hypothetical protein Tco_0574103 [Tanacetum coccineum]
MQGPEKPIKVKGTVQVKYDVDMVKRFQAEIDADAQLAERLQAKEREHMSVKERDRLLMEFIVARKKFFAAKKAVEQRNKTPTKAEKRKKLFTYIKHMAGYKDKDFKVSKKRAGERPSKESAKRQKIEDDAEKAELKACLEIVPGDDNAVNIESLATKYPIVDWKTHILAEEKIQDMLDLYRLVKERFESTSPEGYDRLLWGDLITLFKPNETVYEESGDSMERAAATAISLDAEQGSGNIIRTQSMATLNELIPQETGSGSGPRRQDTMFGDRPAQTWFERLSKQSNDPPLSRFNTFGSGEDSMKLKELIDIYIKLSERVLALENIKITQDLKFINLKKRVKKLEKKKKSRTLQLKRRLFKVRIESSAEKSLGDQEDASKQGRNEINQEEGISWFQEDAMTQGSTPVATAGVSISTAEPSTPPTTTTTFIEDEDLTITQTLMKMRSVKSKENSKEKEYLRLQAELDEEVRFERAREEEASNAALIEEWDSIESRIDADAQLAERLQAEERELMSVEERARLLMEFIAAKKKFFAAKRAEEQRKKPPTKSEQTKKMCIYMKHMAGYKDKNFKGKSFDAIKQMFDKAYKQVNDFVPMHTESSSVK